MGGIQKLKRLFVVQPMLERWTCHTCAVHTGLAEGSAKIRVRAGGLKDLGSGHSSASHLTTLGKSKTCFVPQFPFCTTW